MAIPPGLKGHDSLDRSGNGSLAVRMSVNQIQ